MIEPLDLAILSGDQFFPIMRASLHLPTISARIRRHVAILGGIDHQLFRHAAKIDAGAAPMAALRDTDLRPVLRGDTGAANATGTGADHEQVEFLHREISFHQRSANAFSTT